MLGALLAKAGTEVEAEAEAELKAEAEAEAAELDVAARIAALEEELAAVRAAAALSTPSSTTSSTPSSTTPSATPPPPTTPPAAPSTPSSASPTPPTKGATSAASDAVSWLFGGWPQVAPRPDTGSGLWAGLPRQASSTARLTMVAEREADNANQLAAQAAKSRAFAVEWRRQIADLEGEVEQKQLLLDRTVGERAADPARRAMEELLDQGAGEAA